MPGRADEQHGAARPPDEGGDQEPFPKIPGAQRVGRNRRLRRHIVGGVVGDRPVGNGRRVYFTHHTGAGRVDRIIMRGRVLRHRTTTALALVARQQHVKFKLTQVPPLAYGRYCVLQAHAGKPGVIVDVPAEYDPGNRPVQVHFQPGGVVIIDPSNPRRGR